MSRKVSTTLVGLAGVVALLVSCTSSGQSNNGPITSPVPVTSTSTTPDVIVTDTTTPVPPPTTPTTTDAPTPTDWVGKAEAICQTAIDSYQANTTSSEDPGAKTLAGAAVTAAAADALAALDTGGSAEAAALASAMHARAVAEHAEANVMMNGGDETVTSAAYDAADQRVKAAAAAASAPTCAEMTNQT